MVATPESLQTAAAATPTSRKGDDNAATGATAAASAGGSNYGLFSELEAIYKTGSSGPCQHAFFILTTSKGKDRKEHDLLSHEAEFITFVSQDTVAAGKELVLYGGCGGKENSSTPFTSSILILRDLLQASGNVFDAAIRAYKDYLAHRSTESVDRSTRFPIGDDMEQKAAGTDHSSRQWNIWHRTN